MEPRGSGESGGGKPPRGDVGPVRSIDGEEPGLREMERGQFLRLCGVGAVGTTLLASGGLAGGEARARGVGTGIAGSPGSLRAEFEAAAGEYGVPVGLLMAMGYVNTRWEMPPPEVGGYVAGDPHNRGIYGILALVRNPYADTLGLASEVSGIPPYSLKTGRFANIRGGAALLAEAIRASERLAGRFREELAPGPPGSFHDLLEAIAGRLGSRLSAVTGIGGGMIYARQVLDIVHSGASLRLMDGELVTLQGGTLRPPRLGGIR